VLRFWLTYFHRAGRLLGVLILDSTSLIQAQFRASLDVLDLDATFREGHQLVAKIINSTATPRP
jgi:hypothetical protein